MSQEQFDETDRHILRALQANARTSNADIARELGMAPSAILERIRKLEQRGAITGYEARIDARAVGLGLTAFLFLRADERGGSDKTARALAAIPEVQEVHQVAGDDCLLVKVRAHDTNDLARLLRDRIRSLPNVRESRTTIVLSTTKDSAQIPLDQLDDA